MYVTSDTKPGGTSRVNDPAFHDRSKPASLAFHLRTVGTPAVQMPSITNPLIVSYRDYKGRGHKPINSLANADLRGTQQTAQVTLTGKHSLPPVVNDGGWRNRGLTHSVNIPSLKALHIPAKGRRGLSGLTGMGDLTPAQEAQVSAVMDRVADVEAATGGMLTPQQQQQVRNVKARIARVYAGLGALTPNQVAQIQNVRKRVLSLRSLGGQKRRVAAIRKRVAKVRAGLGQVEAVQDRIADVLAATGGGFNLTPRQQQQVRNVQMRIARVSAGMHGLGDDITELPISSIDTSALTTGLDITGNVPVFPVLNNMGPVTPPVLSTTVPSLYPGEAVTTAGLLQAISNVPVASPSTAVAAASLTGGIASLTKSLSSLFGGSSLPANATPAQQAAAAAAQQAQMSAMLPYILLGGGAIFLVLIFSSGKRR